LKKLTIAVAVVALALLSLFVAGRAPGRRTPSIATGSVLLGANKQSGWDWRARTTADAIVASRDDKWRPYFPSVAKVAPGELIVVYYASPAHTDQSGKILLKRSLDSGRTWSAAKTAVDTPYDDRDASLMVTRAGRVILSYFSRDWIAAPPVVWGTSVVHSDDGGRTWSHPAPVRTRLGWSGTSAPVIELQNGDLLLPLYGGLSGETASRVTVVRSRDGGRTWPVSSEVEVAADPKIDFEEPALLDLGGGRIRVLMRTDRAGGHGYESESRDGGATWTPPSKLAIRPHAPDLLPIALPDKSPAIFESWGDVSGRFGVGRAVVARVRASGRTSDEALLYRGDCGDESYPSAAQLDDGRVFVVYYDACSATIGATYFTFARPSVRRVYPSAGTVEGGTTVHIDGDHFERGTSVLVGGFPARAVTVLNARQIVLQMPPRPAGATDITIKPVTGPAVQVRGAFTYVTRGWTSWWLPNRDADGDGMPDNWELRYSLDPRDSGDASVDLDGDAVPNVAEFQAQSHPRGARAQYFAAGSTRDGFRTRFVLANPTPARATALLRFFSAAGAATQDVVVPPLSVREVDAAPAGTNDFATAIESDTRLAVKRVMQGQADPSPNHAEIGLEPARTWFFAESPADPALRLSYWLHNPSATPAAVKIAYRSANGGEHSRRYTVGPGVPLEIAVAREHAELAAGGVSARLEASTPIVAERTIYGPVRNGSAAAGAACAGSSDVGPSWLLAEGFNMSSGRMALALANFGGARATIDIDYFVPEGYVANRHTLDGGAHSTISLSAESNALEEMPNIWTSVNAGSGRLAVDRWISWGDRATRRGLHCSTGFNEPGQAWLVPVETLAANVRGYLVAANVGRTPARLHLTVLREDAITNAEDYALKPLERLTLNVSDVFPGTRGKAAAVLIETRRSSHVIVEGSTYTVRDDGKWADGNSVKAVRLPPAGPPLPLPAPPSLVPGRLDAPSKVEKAGLPRPAFAVPLRNRNWALEPLGFSVEPPFGTRSVLRLYVGVAGVPIAGENVWLNLYPDGDPTQLIRFPSATPPADFAGARVGDVRAVTFPLQLKSGLYTGFIGSSVTDSHRVAIGWVLIGRPDTPEFRKSLEIVRARGNSDRADEIERLVRQMTNPRR
jgi:hypothetical protein